jgi:hypothetical protein
VNLPPGDSDFSTRWRLIKTGSRKRCRGALQRRARRAGRLATPLPEYLIRDETDHVRHVEYCHIHPVKHDHVGRVRDGRTRRFIATCALDYFRKTGTAIAKRTAISVSAGNGIVGLGRGLRLANSLSELFARRHVRAGIEPSPRARAVTHAPKASIDRSLLAARTSAIHKYFADGDVIF